MARCTAIDLFHENEFKAAYEKKHPKALLEKLNDYQKLDFALINKSTENVCGFIEFKNRGYRSDDYCSTFLNHQKFVSMSEIHRATKLPVWFAIKFHDGHFMWKYNPDDKFPLGFVPSYREAVVCLPICIFKPLFPPNEWAPSIHDLTDEHGNMLGDD